MNDAQILFLRRVEGLAVLKSLLPLIGCKCRIADGSVNHIKHSTERYRWVRLTYVTQPWKRYGSHMSEVRAAWPPE